MKSDLATALFKNVRPAFSSYNHVTDSVSLRYANETQCIEDMQFLSLWNDELKIKTFVQEWPPTHYPYKIVVSEK